MLRLSAASALPGAQREDCPALQIAAAFHEICNFLPISMFTE
jgi:hypothetical protein